MHGQESSAVGRGAVPDAKPDHLGRCTVEKTQSVKIAVLRDQDAAVFTCQFPHVRIACASTMKQPYMECARKHVPQLPNHGLRQLFVEQQPHGSGRDADRSALALGRVGQARANVILSELGKVGQQFGL